MPPSPGGAPDSSETRTTSALLSGNGKHCRAADGDSAGNPSSLARLRASSIRGAEISTPRTRWPRSRPAIAWEPAPQPTSTTSREVVASPCSLRTQQDPPHAFDALSCLLGCALLGVVINEARVRVWVLVHALTRLGARVVAAMRARQSNLELLFLQLPSHIVGAAVTNGIVAQSACRNRRVAPLLS